MSENVSKKPTTKQRRAIEALLEGKKIKDAAMLAGVATRTLQRWRKQPAFSSELSERTAQLMGDAVLRMVGNMDLSSDVLVELAEDKIGHVPFSVRLRAARYIQEGGIKLMEIHELEQRISALEERFNNV